MNLRLPEDLAVALRDLATRTGRSQQDLAREALEEYVRDYDVRDFPRDVRHLITAPTEPFGVLPDSQRLVPPAGWDSTAAIREDRDRR